MVPSSPKTKVILHGSLRDVCPYETLEFVGATAVEVLKALFTQVKEFAPKPGKLPFQVRVVGYDLNDLFAPLKTGELHVVPDFCGGKRGGFIKIALGVALIAGAFLLPAGGLFAGTMFAITPSTLFWAGASMLFGGLLEMMSPAPSLDFGGDYQLSGDPPPSKYLGAPKNTVAIGTRIPIGVGRHILYGHYLSFDIQAVEA